MQDFAELVNGYSRSLSSIASMLDVLVASDAQCGASHNADLATDEGLRFVLKGLTDDEREAMRRYSEVLLDSLPHIVDHAYKTHGDSASDDSVAPSVGFEEVSRRIDAQYESAPPRARAATRILQRKMRRSSVDVFHSIRTREAILVTLVTHFEVLVGEVIKRFYRRAPDALRGKDKSISWKDAVGMRSIRSLREHLIAEEVESALKGTIEDWRKYLATHLRIDIKTFVPDWDQFREYFHRRNLLVHTAGVVNERYLRHFSSDRGRSEDRELKPKDRLITSREYIEEALEAFEGMGLALALCAWRRLYPKATRASDRELFVQIETVLMDERYHSAAMLSYSRMKDKDVPYTTSVLMFLSMAHALRGIEGDSFTMQDEVRELDLTEAPLRWKMAKSAILRDWEEFYRLANDAQSTDLPEEEWDSFPFFKEAWADPRYDEAWRRFLNRSGCAS